MYLFVEPGIILKCIFFQIGRWVFKGFKKLNRIQSIVFDAAYNTNENLLVAAPTGAGKTNIALLTIVHELKNNIKQGVLKKDEFKVSSTLSAIDNNYH